MCKTQAFIAHRRHGELKATDFFYGLYVRRLQVLWTHDQLITADILRNFVEGVQHFHSEVFSRLDYFAL